MTSVIAPPPKYTYLFLKVFPMEFSREEKLALIRILERMAKADNQILPGEMDYLVKVAYYLDLHPDDIHKSKEYSLKEAGALIARMPEDKKMIFRSAMIDMAMADGSIDLQEFKLLIDTFLSIDFLTDPSKSPKLPG